MVRNLPCVWERIYETLEAKPVDSNTKKLSTLLSRLNAKDLLKFVEGFRPDIIACTHFLPAEVLSAQRRKGKLRAPIYTILTDYDIHSMWIQDGVTGYFVASSEMAHALRAKGIGTASVEVTGIPILSEFAKEYPPRAEMRRTLGLNADRHTVLVAAGGFGMMSADEAVKLLADCLPNAQFIVSDKEFRFALNPTPCLYASYEALQLGIQPMFLKVIDRIKTVDMAEKEIVEGVKIIPLPGHSPGGIGVVVETDDGPYVLAGDAVPTYDNLKGDPANNQPYIMSGGYTALQEMWKSFEIIDEIVEGLVRCNI